MYSINNKIYYIYYITIVNSNTGRKYIDVDILKFLRLHNLEFVFFYVFMHDILKDTRYKRSVTPTN